MKYIVLFAGLLFFSGCSSDELSALEKNVSTKRVWAFIHFNVPSEGDDLDSYYYYAEVSESLYAAISANQLNSGFISLENVRYWSNEDIVHEYRDEENRGDLVFRIEDIRKMKRLNKAPIVGLGSEQFEVEKDAEEQEEVKKQVEPNNAIKPG